MTEQSGLYYVVQIVQCKQEEDGTTTKRVVGESVLLKDKPFKVVLRGTSNGGVKIDAFYE